MVSIAGGLVFLEGSGVEKDFLAGSELGPDADTHAVAVVGLAHEI